MGITLLAIGCLVKFKEDLVADYAEKLFEVIKLDAASDINLKDLLNSVSLVFIISGAVAALVGLAGCIGACCEVKLLLVVVSMMFSFHSMSVMFERVLHHLRAIATLVGLAECFGVCSGVTCYYMIKSLKVLVE